MHLSARICAQVTIEFLQYKLRWVHIIPVAQVSSILVSIWKTCHWISFRFMHAVDLCMSRQTSPTVSKTCEKYISSNTQCVIHETINCLLLLLFLIVKDKLNDYFSYLSQHQWGDSWGQYCRSVWDERDSRAHFLQTEVLETHKPWYIYNTLVM